MSASETESRRETWERWTEWPMVAGALGFLAAYAWPILEPDLSRAAVRACVLVTGVVWFAFFVDYVARLLLSRHRWRFVRGHLLDLTVLVVPILRPLRAITLLAALYRLNRRAESSLRGRASAYVVVTVALLLFVASLAVLEAERGEPGATIQSFGDALWWGVTTMTTVGYGDLYPVTVTGRVVAAALMVGGIGLLGVVTAGLASWFLDRLGEEDEEEEDAYRHEMRAELSALTAEVRALRAELARSGR